MSTLELNEIEVIIGGEIITLTGVESEEYIQKLARYIDKKMNELSKSKAGLGPSAFLKTILISVNIADDLFKERERATDAMSAQRDLKEANDKSEKEQSKLKQENAALQSKITQLQKELQNANKELDAYIDNFDKKETTTGQVYKFKK